MPTLAASTKSPMARSSTSTPPSRIRTPGPPTPQPSSPARSRAIQAVREQMEAHRRATAALSKPLSGKVNTSKATRTPATRVASRRTTSPRPLPESSEKTARRASAPPPSRKSSLAPSPLAKPQPSSGDRAAGKTPELARRRQVSTPLKNRPCPTPSITRANTSRPPSVIPPPSLLRHKSLPPVVPPRSIFRQPEPSLTRRSVKNVQPEATPPSVSQEQSATPIQAHSNDVQAHCCNVEAVSSDMSIVRLPALVSYTEPTSFLRSRARELFEDLPHLQETAAAISGFGDPLIADDYTMVLIARQQEKDARARTLTPSTPPRALRSPLLSNASSTSQTLSSTSQTPSPAPSTLLSPTTTYSFTSLLNDTNLVHRSIVSLSCGDERPGLDVPAEWTQASSSRPTSRTSGMSSLPCTAVEQNTAHTDVVAKTSVSASVVLVSKTNLTVVGLAKLWKRMVSARR